MVKIKIVYCDISGIRLKIGKKEFFMGSFVDMTEWKKIEEALEKSEERFRQVAENSQGWVWEVDNKGLYTYSNSMVEKILGYKPEEIVGKKHFYDLFHPEDLKTLKKAAFGVFSKKQSFREFINRNIHKNGKIKWLSTSGVPILDDNGNLLGYRGADTDITEQKKLEEALRESEFRFKMYFENVPLCYQSLDEGGYILNVNKKWSDMIGYSRMEIIGRHFTEFLTRDLERHFDKNFELLKNNGRIENVEYKEEKPLFRLDLQLFSGCIGRNGYSSRADLKSCDGLEDSVLINFKIFFGQVFYKLSLVKHTDRDFNCDNSNFFLGRIFR